MESSTSCSTTAPNSHRSQVDESETFRALAELQRAIAADAPHSSPRGYQAISSKSLAHFKRVRAKKKMLPNFGRLGLACIDADFCNQIFLVKAVFEIYTIEIRLHRSDLKVLRKFVKNIMSQHFPKLVERNFKRFAESLPNLKFLQILRDVRKLN